ncbi:prolyl oligopeptidase family serine peptidase [Irregularibacter muris]|uniref:Prolyl oligopeptidase family serine peptidase n=1 Tax=Irregularibacter muris TaxID=1796619 RepID=A0AAE3HFD2_9FIRM|nr:prolyl oligopeptidase family serine peptidase [Irregularibacter muris]MCR1899571.1 prolyl oligopeptidase family serine peptidase [Irregularibacter muris]
MRPRDFIEVKKVILNHIPCLLVRPTSFEGKLPTLFHYHGWSSSKERHQFLATIIAQYGYQVILPDSNFHGERNPLEEYTSKNILQYFWTIVKQSVDEFKGMREEVQEQYDMDPEAIALSGSSMGGYITASIFAQNPDIKSLITFNGGCSLFKTKELISEKLNIDLDNKMDREEVEKYDPLTYKDSFYPRPILMLHGDADTSVPIEIQRYFLEEVSPLYQEDKGRIELEVYKNMNHHISIRMVKSAVSWLEKYL